MPNCVKYRRKPGRPKKGSKPLCKKSPKSRKKSSKKSPKKSSKKSPKRRKTRSDKGIPRKLPPYPYHLDEEELPPYPYHLDKPKKLKSSLKKRKSKSPKKVSFGKTSYKYI